MGYNFTEEQLAVRDLVRSFAQKEVAPLSRQMDETGWNPELYKQYIATGLHATPVPKPMAEPDWATWNAPSLRTEFGPGRTPGLPCPWKSSWVCADMIRLHGSDGRKRNT